MATSRWSLSLFLLGSFVFTRFTWQKPSLAGPQSFGSVVPLSVFGSAEPQPPLPFPPIIQTFPRLPHIWSPIFPHHQTKSHTNPVPRTNIPCRDKELFSAQCLLRSFHSFSFSSFTKYCTWCLVEISKQHCLFRIFKFLCHRPFLQLQLVPKVVLFSYWQNRVMAILNSKHTICSVLIYYSNQIGCSTQWLVPLCLWQCLLSKTGKRVCYWESGGLEKSLLQLLQVCIFDEVPLWKLYFPAYVGVPPQKMICWDFSSITTLLNLNLLSLAGILSSK